jgi:hypothetical protein
MVKGKHTMFRRFRQWWERRRARPVPEMQRGKVSGALIVNTLLQIIALAPIWYGVGVFIYAGYLAVRYGIEFRR